MTSDYATGEHWVEDVPPRSDVFFMITPALPDAPIPNHATSVEDMVQFTAQRVADELVAAIRRHTPEVRLLSIHVQSEKVETGEAGS